MSSPYSLCDIITVFMVTCLVPGLWIPMLSLKIITDA